MVKSLPIQGTLEHLSKAKILTQVEILLLEINPTGRIKPEQADVGTKMLIAALFIIENKREIIDLNVHHTGLIKTSDGTFWH